jgi:hypothetical protein
MSKKYVSFLMVLLLLAALSFGCGRSSKHDATFSQLVSQADKYSDKVVTFEAFYFNGFEISALAGVLEPTSSGNGRIVPTGTLIWVEGGISQELRDQLYIQTVTPSGYPEYFGKLKVTGKFETGASYGHLNAYQYQIAITNAELLEWTPPAITSTVSVGNLQIKAIDPSYEPLYGVKVVSEEQPNGQLKVTGLTDTDGMVTFTEVKPGIYRFYASSADYTQARMEVNVIGSQTNSFTIRMTSD